MTPNKDLELVIGSAIPVSHDGKSDGFYVRTKIVSYEEAQQLQQAQEKLKKIEEAFAPLHALIFSENYRVADIERLSENVWLLLSKGVRTS